MRAVVGGRSFANRGEVSRNGSRIRELDSQTRNCNTRQRPIFTGFSVRRPPTHALQFSDPVSSRTRHIQKPVRKPGTYTPASTHCKDSDPHLCRFTKPGAPTAVGGRSFANRGEVSRNGSRIRELDSQTRNCNTRQRPIFTGFSVRRPPTHALQFSDPVSSRTRHIQKPVRKPGTYTPASTHCKDSDPHLCRFTKPGAPTAVGGRSFANRGEVSRNGSRIRELDSQTRNCNTRQRPIFTGFSVRRPPTHALQFSDPVSSRTRHIQKPVRKPGTYTPASTHCKDSDPHLCRFTKPGAPTAAVGGRGFANRGEVSRTRSRIRELDSRTRSRIMIRSSSSARSVLRPPQSATAPQLGPTMLGAQPPYGVQIEFNAERLLSPRCDRAAVLVEAIASYPLAHCLGLSGRENGLAGGALQRSFQTAGGASMEPLVDRFRVDAHQRRHVLDGSTILQLRQSSEPLPPMLVALAHRAFAQVGNTLKQIIQPRLPHPTTLRPLGGCYGEDGPQPFLCSLAKAGEAAKQALEPWRAKNAHRPWQAFLQIAQQPGQEQQSAVILRPRDEVPFALGHPEVATDTCEQAIQPSRSKVVALLLRASHPDHREEHVGERHRRRPIEHANAGKDRRSTSLADDQCRLQIKGCHVCDEAVSLGKARSASATDEQFCRVVQNAQPQHVPAGWARPSERHAMTGACARPAQHPDQLKMRTFGNADRTDIDAARTSNACLRS